MIIQKFKWKTKTKVSMSIYIILQADWTLKHIRNIVDDVIHLDVALNAIYSEILTSKCLVKSACSRFSSRMTHNFGLDEKHMGVMMTSQ